MSTDYFQSVVSEGQKLTRSTIGESLTIDSGRQGFQTINPRVTQ